MSAKSGGNTDNAGGSPTQSGVGRGRKAKPAPALPATEPKFLSADEYESEERALAEREAEAKRRQQELEARRQAKVDVDACLTEPELFAKYYAAKRDEDKLLVMEKLYNDKKDRVAFLERKLAKHEAAEKNIYDHLKREIAENKKLAQDLLEDKQDLQRRYDKLTQSHREEAQYLATQNEARLQELEQRIMKLQAECDDLYEFKQNKAQMEADLKRLKEQLEEEERSHKQREAELRHKNIVEKNSLKKEMLKKIKETKLSLLNQTEDQLHTTTKRTIMENEQMTTELEYQSKETERILREQDQLRAENRALVRQLQLAEQAQQLLATRTQLFQKLIKKLNAKLQAQGQEGRDGFEEEEKSAGALRDRSSRRVKALPSGSSTTAAGAASARHLPAVGPAPQSPANRGAASTGIPSRDTAKATAAAGNKNRVLTGRLAPLSPVNASARGGNNTAPRKSSDKESGTNEREKHSEPGSDGHSHPRPPITDFVDPPSAPAEKLSVSTSSPGGFGIPRRLSQPHHLNAGAQQNSGAPQLTVTVIADDDARVRRGNNQLSPASPAGAFPSGRRFSTQEAIPLARVSWTMTDFSLALTKAENEVDGLKTQLQQLVEELTETKSELNGTREALHQAVDQAASERVATLLHEVHSELAGRRIEAAKRSGEDTEPEHINWSDLTVEERALALDYLITRLSVDTHSAPGGHSQRPSLAFDASFVAAAIAPAPVAFGTVAPGRDSPSHRIVARDD